MAGFPPCKLCGKGDRATASIRCGSVETKSGPVAMYTRMCQQCLEHLIGPVLAFRLGQREICGIGNHHCVEEPSPWQEVAVRALEDGTTEHPEESCYG
jgi:hypothetical protein